MVKSRKLNLQLNRTFANDPVFRLRNKPQIDRKGVVQKIIEEQMNISKQEFEINSFILVASANPLVIYYYSSYLELQNKPRKLFNQRQLVTQSSQRSKLPPLRKRFSQQIKNKSQQRRSRTVRIQSHRKIKIIRSCHKISESIIWSESEIIRHFAKKDIISQVKQILTAVFSCGTGYFDQKPDKYKGGFKLLKVKFILDKEQTPFLVGIEDKIPDTLIVTTGSRNLIAGLVKDSIELMMNEISQKKREGKLKKPWTLLFDESQKFHFKVDQKK